MALAIDLTSKTLLFRLTFWQFLLRQKKKKPQAFYPPKRLVTPQVINQNGNKAEIRSEQQNPLVLIQTVA